MFKKRRIIKNFIIIHEFLYLKCSSFKLNSIHKISFAFYFHCSLYAENTIEFLLHYKAFHLLLSSLFYYSLYTKFMIQQIWCSRLWRKSGVMEIRSWFLLQRWYIDVKFLYIYDGSAVLRNSHTSFDLSICHKTKIRT